MKLFGLPARPMGIKVVFIFLLAVSGIPHQLSAQPGDAVLDSALLARKTITAVRAPGGIKIDGEASEAVWKTAPAAGDFVEYGPRNGTLPSCRTTVQFAYDDIAFYILAVMYDPHPDSICRELGRRDQIEALNTDYISFDILPYNDGLTMYEFKVSPANLQNDCKYSAVGQDISWDAVWETAARVTDSAWIAEVKIPYSALRFPKSDIQTWGINMWRNFHRRHEYSTWSWVDNKTQDIFRFYGTVAGMRNIRPPVRLSVSPYVSGYLDKQPGKSDPSYFLRGGLDLRYGINESYTLDMMLIPDFGQVQSDDRVLNLSPFEIRYDEKRQFFTEATELFNKCEIFYTRRVGSGPRNFGLPYGSLRENERVTENPDQTRIINATKLSGRNARGLGVGLFNGMTLASQARLQDTVTGITRRITTQPFTNYNVLVFDQNLKNNSYVTLINTNYWIPDDRYSANVTGVETRLKSPKLNMQVFGRLNVSQKYRETGAPEIGHHYEIALSKPSGKFQYQLYRQVSDRLYDPNDMGFLAYNNDAVNRLRLSWYDFDPKGKVINSQTDFTFLYASRYRPDRFKTLEMTLNNSITFVKYWTSSIYLSCQPLGYHDYYEPRAEGYHYEAPMNVTFDWTFSSNGAKPFRYLHDFGVFYRPETGTINYWIGFVPRFRLSDRLSLTLSMNYDMSLNSRGWVRTAAEEGGLPEIFFGRRDVQTVNNIANVRYIFGTRTSLTLRARHYWSQADYLSFFTLRSDGSLDPAPFEEGHNINFNAFSLDMQFVWYFAPGSEMSVVWKNAVTTAGSDLEKNYFNDLANTLSSPQSNSFSVRILYYLDYLYVKKVLSKRK